MKRFSPRKAQFIVLTISVYLAAGAWVGVSWSQAKPTSVAKATPAAKPIAKKTLAKSPAIVGLIHEDAVWVVGAFDPLRGWRNDTQSKSLFASGQTLKVFDAQRQIGSTTIGAVQSGEEVGGWLAKSSKPFDSENPLIAIGAKHNLMPRKPRPQVLNNPLYQGVVANVLKLEGVNVARPRLTQHVRVDLNGDGTEEVLLVAHSRDEMGRTPRTVRNDYSMAVLRCVVGGKSKTILLDSDVYKTGQQFTASQRFVLAGCYDLDGDGTLEIAIWSGYYEGDSVQIYKFDGKTARRVLTAGWGV